MTTGSAIGPYQVTPFGIVRTTGTPYLQVDIVNKYKIDTNIWGTLVTGTGTVTHVAAESAIRLAAGGAIGTALLRTDEYYRYQAGKAPRLLLTGYSSDTGNANNVRQWGQFDDNDGLFFQHARATAANYFDIVIRSSSGVTSPVTIAQTSWNRDKYPTLDPTKGNIFECTYQWLGVGAVSFFVNGKLVHVQDNANALGAPYMRTAQLPLSAKVTEAGGLAGALGWG